MFRTRLRIPRQGLAPALGLRSTVNARRSLHQVPTLPHDYSNGVPNLMSAGGFALAWTDYMTLVTEKLNALTEGTELEGRDTKTIAIMTAREPSQAPIFNYASMAHNNHFFFTGISPTGSPMPEPLRQELEASFSSVETLRREFVITASAMFGPGFVWLVKAGPGEYRLLPTYLAGSPYPGAHWRAQPADLNTVGHDGSARGYLRNPAFGVGTGGGSISSSSSSSTSAAAAVAVAAAARRRTADLPPGGIELEPLLCLNTWEHAWLLDWGVGAGGKGGKMAYAESWWELIDWEKVADRSGVLRPDLK